MGLISELPAFRAALSMVLRNALHYFPQICLALGFLSFGYRCWTDIWHFLGLSEAI